MKLSAVKADITRLQVVAIVNAANRTLLGGGGVDGAIHRAAGPELLAACRLLGGCETGQVKSTGGFRLPATHVIHAVGPVWHGGNRGEPELLASCYANALTEAERLGARSIAFPCISTGVYRYPAVPAAEIAVRTVMRTAAPEIAEVIFCCFSDGQLQIYQALLSKLAQGERSDG